MTRTIDERIVEMAFENSQFEKGVSTSLGTIDKLKKSLNFDKAADGLNGITSAAQRVNLNPLVDGINTVSSRFSALGIVAITTLVNITNSALNAGKRIADALFIKPITTGLTEYETKLNSIQTILANTEKEGTNLQRVTDALNELNEYSDKTIYNFQEMTRNVGTFTAAGVSLDSSVAAIKGIANLAAISGSNAQQASTAMYQLSQALASGTVKLMDWNSVVNAGMGGQVFQEAIKETARVHGVAIDQMIEQDGSFRETLQRGWFTSEILTETLQKFTGDLNEDQLRTMGYTEEQIKSIIKMGQTATDAATKVKTFTQLFDTLKEAAQSGWAQTWEIILGDFEEAKAFFTEANNILGSMIGASAESRNALLQSWKDLGGRSALIDSVRNAFEGVLSVIKPIKDALVEIFPPVTAQQLYNLSVGLKTLTERFKIGGEAADTLKRIFKGLFAIVDIVLMAFSALGKGVFNLADSLSPTVVSFGEIVAKIADYIVALRDGLKSTNAFGFAVQTVVGVLKTIIGVVKDFFSSFGSGLKAFEGIKLDGLTTFMKNLQVQFAPLGKMAELTGKFLGLIGALVAKIGPIVFKLGSSVADGISNFIDGIMGSLGEFDPERVFEIINGGLLAGVLLAIKKFVDKGAGMFDGVKDVLDSVKGSLEAWQNSLKADILLKIAAALGILTLSVIALSMIDSKKLATALGGMTVMFAQLGFSLAAFQKVSATINPIQIGVMATGLLAISSAMLILSLAVSKLGKLSSKELVKGMLAITTLIGVIKIASNSLATSSTKMIAGAAALIVFSFAIRSLGSAVKSLAALDTDDLAKGLIGVGVLMTELALFMKSTDLSGMGVVKSVGILILAGSVNLLAVAVSKLAEIDTASITKGLIAMGLIFAQLSAFIALTGGAPGLILTAGGIAILSGAMVIMAGVLETLGNLSWDQIAKGLTSIGVALTLIGAAAYLIPPTLILQSAGLIVMAGALVILSKAMVTLGGMSWDEIARGISVLAGSLLVLTVGMSAMSGTISGSAALLIAAGALAVLAPALKVMGSLSFEEIGIGLLALAGVFVVLGVAGAVLSPVVPTLFGLGAAMLLIGVATAAAGIGVLALSAGLSALAVSGAAGAAAMVVVITSIVGLLPMFVKQLGKALLALVDVLVAGAPKLLEGVVTLLNILLDGLLEITPKIVDVVITLVDTLLTKLAEKTPTIVEAGYSVLLGFLKGLSENIAEIVNISYDIINTYINAIAERIPEIVDSGWNLIISWIDGMRMGVEEHLPVLMDSVRELGIAIVKGLVEGITSGQADAKETIIELGQIIIDGFKDLLGINSPSSVFIALAGDIIQGLINGIKMGLTLVRTQMTDLANKMVDALKLKYSSMVEAGEDLVSGLAIGIKNYISIAVQKAAELATAILNKIKSVLGIESPSKEMVSAGMYVDQGLALGISKFAGKVVDSAKDLGNQTISGFNQIVSRVSEFMNSDMNFSPEIRPVLDLSELQRGGSQIDGILSGKRLNVTAASIEASRISSISSRVAEPTAPEQTGRNVAAIQFTQNNYSPKELSRIDIYRQTKNQLLTAQRLVGEI